MLYTSKVPPCHHTPGHICKWGSVKSLVRITVDQKGKPDHLLGMYELVHQGGGHRVDHALRTATLPQFSGRRASLLPKSPKAGRAAEREEGRVRRALPLGLADGPLPLLQTLSAQSFSRLLGDAVPRMSVLLYLLHKLGVEEKRGYPGRKCKFNFKENT